MSDFIYRQIVLRLNAVWQPIGYCSVKSAIIAMNGGLKDTPPAIGVDMQYPFVDGKWDTSWPSFYYPINTWNEWIKLPVREIDFAVHTSKIVFRAPTVIIACNYAKIPDVEPKPSNDAIYERDKLICQYTGRKLTKAEANIDHVIPKYVWKKRGYKGSFESFENKVVSDKKINSLKGNKTNEEVGLKLIRKPKAPPKIKISATIREERHFTWRPFLFKNL
jgi:5-methylcytosine-specific restriction endonuclease McrA